MGKLYLVRHGQTLWNQEKRMQGHKNSDLSVEGVAQAHALKTHLNTLKIDRAWVSPLGRVQQTVDILLSDRDTPVTVDARLKEMGFGEWEGRIKPEIMVTDAHAYQHFQTDPGTFTSPNGESFHDVAARVKPAIAELLALAVDENILIVSHTMTIKIILTLLSDYSIETFWDIPHIPPATLTTINVDANSCDVINVGQIFY